MLGIAGRAGTGVAAAAAFANRRATTAAPPPAEPKNASALFRLDGRVALVTGGSRGLGHACAVGQVNTCTLWIAAMATWRPPNHMVYTHQMCAGAAHLFTVAI